MLYYNAYISIPMAQNNGKIMSKVVSNGGVWLLKVAEHSFQEPMPNSP